MPHLTNNLIPSPLVLRSTLYDTPVPSIIKTIIFVLFVRVLKYHPLTYLIVNYFRKMFHMRCFSTFLVLFFYLDLIIRFPKNVITEIFSIILNNETRRFSIRIFSVIAAACVIPLIMHDPENSKPAGTYLFKVNN